MHERPLSVQVRSEVQADEATLRTACEASAVPAQGDFCPFLKVVVRPAGERTVVAVSGDIDIDTERQLQRSLREALTRSVGGLDLDLTQVDFCDCSGLNVLLRIRRLALTDAKRVDIRAAGPAVQRLLGLTHTSVLFAPARRPHTMTAHGHHRHPAKNDRAHEEDGLSDDAEQDLRIEVVQLKRAMQTRPVIDLARGVLMASFGLSADDAWSVLVEVSQHTNTKVHHLAEDLVGAVNGDPLPEPLRQQVSAAVAEVLGSHAPSHPSAEWTSPTDRRSPSGGDRDTPPMSDRRRDLSADPL
jgi:anti-anti-sigma factor